MSKTQLSQFFSVWRFTVSYKCKDSDSTGSAPSIKANAGPELQAIKCAVSELLMFSANLINIAWTIIPSEDKCSFRPQKSEVCQHQKKKKNKTKKKTGYHTPNQSVMWTRMTHSGAGEVYKPGGGETSREISGRGGPPLLSGPTNIVVVFHKQKSFSICNAALHHSVRSNTQRSHTQGHVLADLNTHSPARTMKTVHSLTTTPIFPVSHLIRGQWARLLSHF